jgi:O-methyltransferase involved in polyketide biosynthesis
MRGGVEMTAYLVNESRARRPDLAGDPLATDWVPGADRAAVRELWDEFAGAVYGHDDLVVSLRGRCVLDALAQSLDRDPDTVLVVCGAGFSSYPWLLPFPAALEVDLPDIVTAKRRRVAELVATGVIDDRDVGYLAADLSLPAARRRVVDQARDLARGRPVAYVAEGLVFYLPAEAARAVVGLGRDVASQVLTAVSYWPTSLAGNQVLAALRRWFRLRSVPEVPTYLAREELASLLGGRVTDYGQEDLQYRYLGDVVVAEPDLIPEYVTVAHT